MVPIAGSYAGTCTRSPGAKILQGREDRLRLHTFAEFDVGLPRNHKAIRADDELRRDREKKRLISLIFFKFNADFLVKPADLGADPEDKPKRERITEVDITQNRKRQTIARAVGAREPRT